MRAPLRARVAEDFPRADEVPVAALRAVPLDVLTALAVCGVLRADERVEEVPLADLPRAERVVERVVVFVAAERAVRAREVLDVAALDWVEPDFAERAPCLPVDEADALRDLVLAPEDFPDVLPRDARVAGPPPLSRALSKAMATACFWAFFLLAGSLLPMEPLSS